MADRKGHAVLARWPADKAMRHARDRIRELSARSRLLLPPEGVGAGNQHVPARLGAFKVRSLHLLPREDQGRPTLRLAIFMGKRHKRGRRFGLNVVAYLSPDRCGLIRLSGIVVPPRANKPGEKPQPPVNGVGEPGAGEPDARFEVAGAGKGVTWPRSPGVAQPTGKPAEYRPWALPSDIITSPAPDPTVSGQSS